MQAIHILLVEDNEGDIVLITEAFEDIKLKNEISIVRNGEEAISFLEKKNGFENVKIPDLIILDINLPKINGHEVLQFIKTNDNYKTIPVIMLTTSSSESDISASYKNHANCYITKPVNVDEFLTAVTSIEEFWISLVTLPSEVSSKSN